MYEVTKQKIIIGLFLKKINKFGIYKIILRKFTFNTYKP